ncbi:pyruvate dehydrogenase (acetyl-transferring) E1 component subunit alpha [Desulfopila aestuarii]|uniref:Pyruvate dehydrogenase E1 component subunit alpha n=1 Tax=Desulfopila aestuarii DSM 18488 TaxID=1121416 RepID=A0A1M7YJJ9_9BACT|nr:pyruvate dehydrogenase (acetyl-transferring) E1 component subunit alpha [Desulfopila aestuarii]SHO52756.1 pyruvate dehydrogenase E1 component alpha subunit [Desulfopila aestuarii DSM 18488]
MTTPIDKNHATKLLRQMLLIRRFEEKSAELYSATKIRGFLHLYIGEEAVAVGVMAALTPEDAVVATYREHGQALARGMSADSIMAEMYGKLEGCCKGRGGSMHIFDSSTHFYGGNAIVGGGLPVAVGLALADSMLGRNRVTCCFFGDGAVAEGAFHESMNMAALWKLPVLFLCENNLYAMGTAIRYTQAQPDIAAKAVGYRMKSAAVDGMDVMAVEAAASKAADHIRQGNGPYLLECRTYRFRPHSMFDTELYRSKEEVEQWKAHDPIEKLTRRLSDAGLLNDQDRAALEQDVAREVESAVAFAEAGTWEPVENLTSFVYSERREL